MELDLDPALTLEIMRGSMAYSRIMDTKGEKMIHQDFTPQARLSQHLKDVRLMLAATDKALPLTRTHSELLEKAESLGCGDLDNSAIIKAYE
jgi:3-hydroxyisobutyrate dehydrogenase-like beta-hydroxyacid dehydrogenase